MNLRVSIYNNIYILIIKITFEINPLDNSWDVRNYASNYAFRRGYVDYIKSLYKFLNLTYI
jgi:hypothetical protein